MPPLGFELSVLYFEDILKGLKKEGRLNVDHKKPLCIYTYMEKSPKQLYYQIDMSQEERHA